MWLVAQQQVGNRGYELEVKRRAAHLVSRDLEGDCTNRGLSPPPHGDPHTGTPPEVAKSRCPAMVEMDTDPCDSGTLHDDS